jgi:hypothetical protein
MTGDERGDMIDRRPALIRPPVRRGVTWRAVLLALILLVTLSPLAFAAEMVLGTVYKLAAGVPPIVPIAFLFLLLVLNPLLGRLLRGRLSRRELLAAYAIASFGGPVMTHGVLVWILSLVIGIRHLALARPEWRATFFQYLPAWASPVDAAAVEGYFRGESPVPWALWWPSLLHWAALFIALVLCILFLLILFSRQWIVSERLTYPFAQVPLEMAQQDRMTGVGRLPFSKAFWAGFIVAFVLSLNNSLHELFPALPHIPVGTTLLMPYQKVGPMAGLGDIFFYLEYWAVAIAYLIPKDLSFSVWFFWLWRVAMTVTAITFGAQPEKPTDWGSASFPAPGCQGAGALLAVAALALWAARRHLAGSIRLALAGRREDRESWEPVAYRYVLLGFLLSASFLVYFCVALGGRAWFALLFVLLVVTYYLVWSRLRAETGMGFIGYPLGADSLMVAALGSTAFRPAELTSLAITRWVYAGSGGHSIDAISGNALEALKIADSAGIPRRPLVLAMVVGLLVSLGVSSYVLLKGMYRVGFWGLSSPIAVIWGQSELSTAGSSMFTRITTPTGVDRFGVLFVGVGALVTTLLGWARVRFWWWPFHPIGYLVSQSWEASQFWQPFFMGWVAKVLVVRYGGLRLYQQTVPLAIGVIVGDRLLYVLWAIATAVSRAQG